MKNELLAVKEKFRNLSEYSKQLNRWILKSIGVWPVSSSATRTEKIVSQILVVICWCFSLFTIIPNLLRIILEKENAYRKLKTLGPLSHWFVGGYNYAVLLLRKDDIRYCIKHVKTDWTIITRPENQLVMLKHAKLGRYVASLSAGFLQGGVFCYCIVAGSTKEIIEIGNETISKHALPCPVYKIPVDTNLTHTIIFIIQFLSGFVASSSATAAFSLAITFSSHAVGQLNVMTVWINEFVNRPRGWNKNDCINRISVIVEHHLRILSLIARIERTMTTTCFMEILKCMVVIFWCTGTFNYVILLLHKDDICFCIEHVRADWKIITRVKDQRVMFKAAKLGRYIASICAEFTFGAILGFCIISGTFKQTMKVRNETIITYSLPCPVYKLPIHTNPTHSIIFTTQFLSAIILSANASGFFTLVATLTSHAFGQLNVMMTWISEFVNQTSNHNKNTNINVIGVIVEHHSRILSHWLIGGINYVVLLLHKNDIRSCIEHVQADWKIVARPKDQQVMLRYAKVGRYITGFCAGFMQGGVFCYCVMLGIFKQSVKIGNETVAVYSVPCPPYKLPIYTNPTHSIVLATQFLSGFIVSSSAVAAFSLNATFANHALGQLNVINMWINEFVNYPRNQSKDSCVNEIDVIVEHHLRILSFIARIEHMLCLICMMETFKCTLGMCMPSYLILACKKVGDVVYMTNWYELPDKDILNLIMIISRSSKEVKITAGKLVTMSVYTFGNVCSLCSPTKTKVIETQKDLNRHVQLQIVKSVFAYLNILRQTTMM
ncbi:hypothetical protein WN48_04720 [Eufriesea mexicana]|nr:hypothetical protein WN48_04720 [Eufriesea mexicana]